jgi:hypothetical protein
MDIKSSTPNENLTILFDVKLNRPGCVLLQAATTNSRSSGFVSTQFNAETWLVAPTKDMRLITGTREQWLGKAKQVNQTTL